MPCCHDSRCPGTSSAAARQTVRWRRALWTALLINGGFFLTETVAGVMAGSASLQADALDFFGDTANYAISLAVTGMALAWRSRAALLKGATMLVFALWVLGDTVRHAWIGTLPQAETMGIVGAAALVANGAVALMLYCFRNGDANMRSVWICSRNDAIGNLAVLLAALGVFGTGTGWPDLVVACVMGGLGLHGGGQIVRHALTEAGGPSSPETGRAA
ncbi:cation transporter [Gluconacetobacter azotocaptans]|uniref:Cation transporter n=2 Tax=Gluconacetobacter azotocaptans TaxID=142834 RepID=A0A7W4JST3_9PROT|nr:cation transporter [Gluconacetobacter azotocaptans]MBB2190209.1 cation transporter [Gluconacetobacter azotocaptans]MBM9402414.1 cation transporter [Gluconacetobacter azotocaptans]GBQ29851.1 cation efflux system protein [Gluconacetobacter azotocaptans DSM 13594]